MKALGVIPSRLGSVRLPKKPLRLIAGKPLIIRVCENVRKSKLLKDIVVATDSKEIVKLVGEFGYKAVMTSKKHNSGTERVCEVARKLKEYDVFVNIQGDEPMLRGNTVDRLLRGFSGERQADVASLCISKSSKSEYLDPNTVKVVLDKKGYGLYFSRSPIPYDRAGKDSGFLKHLGIYAYKRKFLTNLSRLKPSTLEAREKLEQLKWLDNGFKIRMIMCNDDSIGVDTKKDLLAVERLIKKQEK